MATIKLREHQNAIIDEVLAATEASIDHSHAIFSKETSNITDVQKVEDFCDFIAAHEVSITNHRLDLQNRLTKHIDDISEKLERISHIDAELQHIRNQTEEDKVICLKALNDAPDPARDFQFTLKRDLEDSNREIVERMKFELDKIDKEERVARKKVLVSLY